MRWHDAKCALLEVMPYLHNSTTWACDELHAKAIVIELCREIIKEVDGNV